MSRARILFILGFMLSMGAGVVVGMLVGHAPKAAAVNGGMDGDLGLTPQQAEQVHAIWSAVRQRDGHGGDPRRALSKERDKAILQLIPTDRKPDYDRIMQEHDTKVAEMNKERERVMQEAEQKMKAILTDAQWKKFEEIKRDRDAHGRGPHPPPHGGSSRPSSRGVDRPIDNDPHDRPQ